MKQLKENKILKIGSKFGINFGFFFFENFNTIKSKNFF